jgi:hypothetical protein
MRLDGGHLWLWDGSRARTLPVVPPQEADSAAFSRPGLAPVRQWFLGDDDNSLFVVEGMTREADAATLDTLETPLRMRETDLSQRPRVDVFERTVRPCRQPMRLVADTEPCPDPEVWAPGGVIRGCAVLTHWEQTRQSHDEDLPEAAGHRTRYLRTTQGWRATELDQTWGDEPLLEISADGSRWVKAQTDDGCCGWSNDSSDQTFFGDADTTGIVFDEWSAFGNKDYDVSFFTADARIAPNGRRVALSVHATEAPGADIRLSADGRADSHELDSIRASLANLPMVEIVQPGPRPAEILHLPHSELIGWASDSEVLVVENGHIVAVDVLTQERRRSGILVRTPADAQVVWR